MLRYSLSGLFVLTLLIAIGCGALQSASDVWRYSILTGAVLLAIVAALAAAYRRGRARWFCLGFAIVSAGYLLLEFAPALTPGDGFFGHKCVDWLFTAMHGQEPVVAVPGPDGVVELRLSPDVKSIDLNREIERLTHGKGGGVFRISLVTVEPTADRKSFRQIAHGLLSLPLGWLGGMIALALYSALARRAPPEDRANETAST